MESALDVLSRAATMVQDNTNETRLTSKELPTTSWRRERRLRTGEYHQSHHSHVVQGSSISCAQNLSSAPPPTAQNQNTSESSHLSSVSNSNSELNQNGHQISIMMAAAAAASMRPFCETTNRCSSPMSSPQQSSLTEHIHHLGQRAHTHVLQHVTASEIDDAPLDMSVNNLKQRCSPPPPYREPLPGSNFSSSLSRPSVITQAPPKRDKDSSLVHNRENDNRSCESIDEHFRRSLGNDYFALFSKNSPSNHSTKTPSPQPQQQQQATVHNKTPPPAPLEEADVNPPPAYPSNFSPAHLQTISQQAPILTTKTNSVLLAPVSLTTQKKQTRSSSPSLPLAVRSVMQPQHQSPLMLQKTSTKTTSSPLSSPISPASIKNFILCNTIQAPDYKSSSRSSTTSPLPLNHQKQQSLAATEHQQQQSTATTQFSVVDKSSLPPSSDMPVVPVPNPSPNLPAIMRIKTEPGVHGVKSYNPTPPASPTSTTNPTNSSTNNSLILPSPSSPKELSWKLPINSTNASADVLASVDDHFAKALGDTWKKLQESKDIRK